MTYKVHNILRQMWDPATLESPVVLLILDKHNLDYGPYILSCIYQITSVL